MCDKHLNILCHGNRLKAIEALSLNTQPTQSSVYNAWALNAKNPYSLPAQCIQHNVYTRYGVHYMEPC